MANTQGLTDEEMIKSVNETVIRGWSDSTTATAADSGVGVGGGGAPRVSTSSRRLAERFDASHMGERGPSAKVIRKSNNSNNTDNTAKRRTPVKIATPKGKEYSTTNKDDDNDVDTSQPQASPAAPPPPILKDVIVERKRTKKGRSKLQQEQQQQVADATTSSARPTLTTPRHLHSVPAPRQGFPSLQKPMGTFVPKTNFNHHYKTGVPGGGSSRSPSSSTAASSNKNTVATANMNDIAVLKQASQRDADQMLAGMSPDEILETAQELRETILSPKALAFLQNRKTKKTTAGGIPTQAESDKKNNNTTIKTSRAETAVAVEPMTAVDKTTTITTKNDPDEADGLEKERMAKLLSSVRTYDDMDAIYRTEMGDQASDAFVKKEDRINASSSSLSSSTNNNDPFQVACDLLRSTAPRQTLWAVRTVRDRLRQDYQAGKTFRLPANHHQNWPYPVLLPVSLRCILDEPPNKVNGFALHTHALEALYLLLRLRCNVHHDVHLDDNITDDPVAVYQLYFGQDTVPSPPLDTLYAASTDVKPLSAGEHENVAYATASSSATATQDGQKFIKDPLWTLLSQMKIIPRLAALVKYPLPKEAWLAAIGTLAMVAMRSPGAATAMVQHKSLLKDLASSTWDATESKTVRDDSILLAVVRLWTLLARQSRAAAAGLELPPWGLLLGGKNSKPAKHGKSTLQQWTLVLWRTLLRYGLATNELEAMLTLAVPHVSVLSHGNLLAAEFFRCWALCLDVHHCRIKIAGGEAILQHELRQLVKIRAWLSSFYRKALSQLEEIDETSVSGDSMVFLSACLRLCQQYIITAEDVTPNPPGEYKSEDSTSDDELSCLKALQGMIHTGVLSRTLSLIAPWLFQNETQETHIFEAASSGLLVAFHLVFRSLQSRVREGTHEQSQAALSSLETSLSDTLVDTVTKQAAEAPVETNEIPHLVSLGWRNRARCTILELVRMTCENRRIVPAIRTAMGVSTLSCLQVGDEALVDRVARLEIARLPEDLRAMVLGQLQSTPHKQNQLKHSLALHREFFLNQAGNGEAQSMRSEADSMGPKREEVDAVGLPLGEFWLWKVLAGSASSDTPVERIVKVVHTSLSVIDELEDAQTSGVCQYARMLAEGSKMYFLMNLCMQSEDVLGDDAIIEVAEHLRRKYFLLVDTGFVKAFTESCLTHSSLQPPGNNPPEETSDSGHEATAEEEKLAATLLGDDETSTSIFSGKRLRAILDILNDLCTAFCDYGAQYPYFAACLRLFLFPAFPPQIRCQLLCRAHGLLHLLSAPSDDMDPLILASFLEEGLPNGDFLNSLASCFARSGPSRTQGLVEHIAIATMGKSLGAAAQKGSLESLQHVLTNLQPLVLHRVTKVAQFYRERDPTKVELSQYVLSLKCSEDDGMAWDDVVSLSS